MLHIVRGHCKMPFEDSEESILERALKFILKQRLE